MTSRNRGLVMQLSRREFVGTVMAAAAASRAFATEEPAARLPFAFSLYGMRNLSLDAALAACVRIGYDAVELALMAGWPAEPRRLTRDDRRGVRDRLRELRLGLPALMENLPLDTAEGARASIERLQAAFDLGRELSPDQPPLVE